MAERYDKQADDSYNSMLERRTSYENPDNLLYPENLADPKYGNHRVVFSINVQGGGEIVRKNTQPTIPLRENKSNRVPYSGQVARGIGQWAGLEMAAPKRRLAAAIHLYVPETVTKSYSAQWGEENMDGVLESLSQAIIKGQEDYNNAKGTKSDKWIEGLKGGASAGWEAAKKTMVQNSSIVQKAFGITPGNSKAQLLFQGVDFGTFQFDYRFAPKSQKEAENVMKIIRTFRHHMLPEYLNDEQFLYVYPSEFDIAYYFGVDENPYMEKHITAVLTNININYNPNGQFTTFANGMPTHINMTLQFKELGTPTKEVSPHNASGV